MWRYILLSPPFSAGTHLHGHRRLLVIPLNEFATFIKDQIDFLTDGRPTSGPAMLAEIICPQVTAFIEGHMAMGSAHLHGDGIMVCIAKGFI